MLLLLIPLFAGFILLQQRPSGGAGGQSGKGQGKGQGQGGPPTVPIAVATATQGDIGVNVNALGYVTPLSTITVRSRVDGELMAIHYREGQIVHKDEVLAEIDPRPFQAALMQAEGLYDAFGQRQVATLFRPRPATTRRWHRTGRQC